MLVPLYLAVCTPPTDMVWDHPVEGFLGACPMCVGAAQIPHKDDLHLRSLRGRFHVVVDGRHRIMGSVSQVAEGGLGGRCHCGRVE